MKKSYLAFILIIMHAFLVSMYFTSRIGQIFNFIVVADALIMMIVLTEVFNVYIFHKKKVVRIEHAN